MSYRVVTHRTGPAQGKKAVIFDRSETMMLILKHLLTKVGFLVILAADAENAMALIHSEKPQLLVWELDRRPEIDFNMLQDIQKYGLNRPYVILVSTPETLSDDAPIEVLGSGDVFIKPFEPGHMVRRIEWLVKHERIK